MKSRGKHVKITNRKESNEKLLLRIKLRIIREERWYKTSKPRKQKVRTEIFYKNKGELIAKKIEILE